MNIKVGNTVLAKLPNSKLVYWFHIKEDRNIMFMGNIVGSSQFIPILRNEIICVYNYEVDVALRVKHSVLIGPYARSTLIRSINEHKCLHEQSEAQKRHTTKLFAKAYGIEDFDDGYSASESESKSESESEESESESESSDEETIFNDIQREIAKARILSYLQDLDNKIKAAEPKEEPKEQSAFERKIARVREAQKEYYRVYRRNRK